MASNDSEPRPLIGVTSYLERATFGIWQQDSALLSRDYVDSVARVGGIPVLVPPIGDGYRELAARLDGLILSGGADVDPARYHEQPSPLTESLRPERDVFEFALLAEVLAAGLPVLAICRGIQVLNAALGGTLHQHLPGTVGHDRHRPRMGVFGTNQVTVVPGTRLAAILGTEVKVSCHHHQALDRIADGLVVTATADDGTVEAVESTGETFVVGVQWHPEQDSGDDRLAAALVNAALHNESRTR